MGDARAEQARRVARELLEAEGEAALSMRRLAAAMGIRAPSLYKHVPDKAALEVGLIADGIGELGAALAAAEPSLSGIARAYRAWALAHPHLYGLMTERPLPRDRLPAGLEDSAAAPLLALAGDEHRARALWAAAHGLVTLELNDRFPPGADLDAAWAALVAAFA
ncbi:MAG: TetR/AcrR family transcriptional regulator [Solirubrobacteraceae bacterium]